MNRTMSMLALAGVMAAGQAMPARAINKEWSAALGFLGGVLVSEAMRPCPPPVYREAPPRYGPPDYYYGRPPHEPVRVIVEPPRPSGRYEVREEQVWVPGRWVYERTECGQTRRVWQEGYYRTVRTRVWVEEPCDRW